MADHLREQILDAVQTALTGLTTTGSNVTRLRVAALSESDLPGLNIVMGEELGLGDRGQSVFNAIDRQLEIVIEVRVRQDEGAVDSMLNTIEAEVYAAMRGLSLTGIQHRYWAATSSPELVEDSVVPVALMQITWIVEYRHALDDATSAGA